MERLRENYSFAPSFYTRLNENQSQRYHSRLTESLNNYEIKDVIKLAEALGGKLTEKKDIEIFEKILKHIKDKSDKQFKIWKLPIGRYGNMNGNKRIYPLKLWQNVRDKQQNTWKGVCGLCDHPVADNDPGEFKNQAVIWHDIDVPEEGGLTFGYGSFVGPFGHLAQEILEHGGRVGTSSSGFGDVDPITKTVDPNTYIIERLADLVLNPSQGTFGTSDNPHISSEFLNDIHDGATIEFNKQKPTVREQQSQILGQIKGKEMTGENNVVDAVQMQQQQNPVAAQGADPNAAAGQAAQAGAAQAQQGAQQQLQQSKEKESLQERKMSGTLTKIEEKAFRKYVQTFIEDANKMENPIQRLNECVDILNCFEEGNCPDLKESLEQQLIEEKGKLEKLVETVVTTEKDFGMPLEKFREAAEGITAQGILLQEQVTDYKELCDGLAKRNVILKEKNDQLEKIIKMDRKLSEKKIFETNKDVVSKSTELENLQEEVEKLTTKNEHLVERVSKLSLSNKKFEKENDMLTAKLKEAGNIMKEVKNQNALKEQADSKTDNEMLKLHERIAQLEAEKTEVESNYAAQSRRFNKLQESFAAYKKEVNDTYNPVAHMMPKASERVGKYLNLREGKGIEIEAYWNDLVKNYGENVTPFEDKIRGAKTLKEATSTFLRYRTQIDPDFGVGQPQEHAYGSRNDRARLYEHHGIVNPVDSYNNSSIEQKNEDFLKKLKESGLQ